MAALVGQYELARVARVSLDVLPYRAAGCGALVVAAGMWIPLDQLLPILAPSAGQPSINNLGPRRVGCRSNCNEALMEQRRGFLGFPGPGHPSRSCT